MSLKPQSLFLKLSFSFWVLIFLLAGLQFLLLFRFWTAAENERAQSLNWELATNIARTLRPTLVSNDAIEQLPAALGRVAGHNTEIDIYVLDEFGKPLAWSYRAPIDPTQAVPVELLESFLGTHPSRTVPIYGPNPSTPGYERPFVAERIEIQDRPGYLYIVLGGLRSKIYRGALLDRYLIFGGSITSLLVALSAAVLGTIVFSVITRRFRVIAKAVNSIAAGDYSIRTGVEGNDEVAQLGSQIDVMAKTIETSIEKLKAADESRRQLLTNISHDLRGPITALRAHLEIAQRDFEELPPAEKQLRFARIIGTVDTLTQLFNQLFELSKLESGGLLPEREQFAIVDLITEEVFFDQQPFATQRGVTLKIEAAGPFPLVHGDPQMTYRVLANLIKNAIAHTPEGGTVLVALALSGSKLLISVADTGVGIAQADLPKIFDRFYSGDKGRTSHAGGSGLGLAIVKQILILHGEEISVESEEGVGTCFCFSLPTVARAEADR